jgi:hypothetical protein
VQYIRPLWVYTWHNRSCPNLCSSYYNGCLVSWTVLSLTATKLKSLIFSMSAFSDTSNICGFMILYDLCSLPGQFLYIIINILRKCKKCTEINKYLVDIFIYTLCVNNWGSFSCAERITFTTFLNVVFLLHQRVRDLNVIMKQHQLNILNRQKYFSENPLKYIIMIFDRKYA